GMNNEKYEIGSFVIEVQKIFGITHMAQIENRTHGKMVGDIVQTLGYEYLGAIDNHAINAAHAIRQGIAEKGEIYVVAHSQGTAIFERALALLKPEERSKIHYFGAGSEVFIDENKYGLASAVNVKNEGDKIPDMGNKWRITNWFIPSEWSRKGKLDWTNINVNAEGNHHSFLTYYINALKQWHNGEDIR
ncbi:MAG: hypothetical protein LHV69_11900, partial [Elusimicrobia bacterium]|nr:hypothetical protein [Candidatus Obscuribacterium magneticum]